MKPFHPDQKVICLKGYIYYGPPHLKTGGTYTVLRCDRDYVYIKEIYAGRYGFYHSTFISLQLSQSSIT